MQNEWVFLRWWDSVEIETVLRHTINVELVMVIVCAMVYVVWNRWLSYSDRKLKRDIDYYLKLVREYAVSGQDNGSLSERYRWKSTYFLVQLVHAIDELKLSAAEHDARRARVRRHILESVLLARARSLARSRFAGRRALALSCFRLWPRTDEDSQIIALMKDPAPVIRLGAARLALRIGSEKSVDAIIEFLQSEKRYVRNLIHVSALEASPAFVEKIRRRLVTMSDVFVQKLCLDLISSQLNDEIDGAKIFALAKSPNKEMRIAAIRALCRSRCKNAFQALSQTIHDNEWEVRAATCRLTGDHRFVEGIAMLVKASHDPEWWVRRNATIALLDLGPLGEHALQDITKDSDRFARESAELALKTLAASKMAVSV